MLALTLVGVNTISLMPPKRPLSWQESIGTIIFAPVVETFLLAGLVNILSRVTKRPVQIAALSALLWGSFHALFGLLWFFGTVWSFFVFTVAYIVWKKVTFSHGLVAASLPHALVNSSAMLLLLLAERG
ncbi:MAG: CPBP family glutamic-type intramembrane protease [Usitatibacteraceae bacterium]